MGLGQGDQIVAMQLRTPAFVSAVLLQQRLAQRQGHRRLRAGITPPLAAQHAHWIMPFVTGAVEPSLERGDAEADRRAGAGVTPFAGRQLLQRRAQRALRRRRCQKRTDNREPQPRPTLMHPRSVSLRHARPSENAPGDGKRPHRGVATRILCGSLAPVRKRASPMRRRSAARGSAARR